MVSDFQGKQTLRIDFGGDFSEMVHHLGRFRFVKMCLTMKEAKPDNKM